MSGYSDSTAMPATNCRGRASECYGYHGRYDLHTCLADNHNMRTEPANGRVPCQASDKRWAEPGRTACAYHREFGRDLS